MVAAVSHHIKTNSARKLEGTGWRDHQKSDCTDKALAPYRWHPFPQDVSPPLPVLSHFQLLFWEMASMPHCHCKAPLHLPPPGTQPIFTQGQEKLEYLHYTNSGFSVRTK